MLANLWYTSSMSENDQSQHKITLSLPRETWEAMVDLAREHQRSFTKEVIWALQEYIRRQRRQRQTEE